MLQPQELKGIAPVRSVEALHPKMVGPVRRLRQYLVDSYETRRTQFLFEIFESFRTPHRQAYLLTKGTTKAGPWESSHQFGLAVDLVPFLTAEEAKPLGVAPGWHWPLADNPCWEFLGEAAAKFGLQRPISWDKTHVRHPLFVKVYRTLL